VSRDLKSMLAYEAKRRPAVAELVERAEHLTDEDLATVAVPMPWYRKALRLVRDQRRKEATIQGGDFARFMVEMPPSPAPMGETRQWTHDATFIKTDGWMFEITPGFLIWLPEGGGVWIGTVFSKSIDSRLVAQTTTQGRMTHNEYRDMRAQKAIIDCPISAPVIDLTRSTAAVHRLSDLGVRIG